MRLLKTLEEPPEYVIFHPGNDGGAQDTDHDPVAVPAL